MSLLQGLTRTPELFSLTGKLQLKACWFDRAADSFREALNADVSQGVVCNQHSGLLKITHFQLLKSCVFKFSLFESTLIMNQYWYWTMYKYQYPLVQCMKIRHRDEPNNLLASMPIGKKIVSKKFFEEKGPGTSLR